MRDDEPADGVVLRAVRGGTRRRVDFISRSYARRQPTVICGGPRCWRGSIPFGGRGRAAGARAGTPRPPARRGGRRAPASARGGGPSGAAGFARGGGRPPSRGFFR